MKTDKRCSDDTVKALAATIDAFLTADMRAAAIDAQKALQAPIPPMAIVEKLNLASRTFAGDLLRAVVESLTDDQRWLIAIIAAASEMHRTSRGSPASLLDVCGSITGYSADQLFTLGDGLERVMDQIGRRASPTLRLVEMPVTDLRPN